MRIFPTVLYLLAALVATLPARAANPQRVALVIGNGGYKYVPGLANSRNDARLIADTLVGEGFTLIGGGAQLDLDKAGFDRRVQQFGQQMGHGSVAIFYYAGHGLQIGGVNYLVPIDANPVREADSDYQLVDASHILHQMRDADTNLNLIILDACRNNPFGGRGLRSASSGLAQMQAPAGTFISYATQPGNVAQDGADGHGPYAKALAAAMRTPGLDLFQVFNQTGLTVSEATGGEQQPWMSNSPIRGQFFFVPPGSTVTITTPANAADPELVFWKSIRDGSDPRAFQAYLQQYPNGRFASLARIKMDGAARASAAPSRTPSGSGLRILTTEPGAGEIGSGERVLIDDKSCPTGQIKEVIGGQQRQNIPRQRHCIPSP